MQDCVDWRDGSRAMRRGGGEGWHRFCTPSLFSFLQNPPLSRTPFMALYSGANDTILRTEMKLWILKHNRRCGVIFAPTMSKLIGRRQMGMVVRVLTLLIFTRSYLPSIIRFDLSPVETSVCIVKFSSLFVISYVCSSSIEVTCDVTVTFFEDEMTRFKAIPLIKIELCTDAPYDTKIIVWYLNVNILCQISRYYSDLFIYEPYRVKVFFFS